MGYKSSKKQTGGGGNDAIPGGDYSLRIKQAEFKKTNAGDGRYLNALFQVTTGKQKGLSFFDLFNTKNPSKQAQEIGLGHINNMLQAIYGSGKSIDNDKALIKALVGREIKATVKVEKAMKKKYKDKNKIVRIIMADSKKKKGGKNKQSTSAPWEKKKKGSKKSKKGKKGKK